MKIKFREIRMSKKNKERLELINSIIEEYQQDGYVLTLRQLYYQLVSRDIIPNKQSEYAKLSTLLKEGRMSGFVDWDAIEDRLRQPYTPPSFAGPEEILKAAIDQYALPRMANQPVYIEVWVEKDALSGVLKRITEKYHIPILVNRGYSSVSAMYDSFRRFERECVYDKDGDVHKPTKRSIKILYLGDFDPSGLDMIRDIEDRILEFRDGDHDFGSWVHEMDFEIESIALTKQQINQYDPPPNPAKITDPRAKEFIRNHGRTSWEVDALKPEILNDLLERTIISNINMDFYNASLELEKKDKKKLEGLMRHL